MRYLNGQIQGQKVTLKLPGAVGRSDEELLFNGQTVSEIEIMKTLEIVVMILHYRHT